MNLMFWKKKADESHAGEMSEASSVPRARIKALVAGLTEKLKSPPPFKAEIPATAETDASSAKTASPEPDAATESERAGALARIKSRLPSLFLKPAAASADAEQGGAPARRINPIAVAAMLLLLLLAAFGYAVWSIVLSSPDPKNGVSELIEDKHASDSPQPIIMPASAPVAASDALAASEVLAASAPAGTDAALVVPAADGHASQATSSVTAAPASHAPQTELEALRQKNAELQAQIDELKKARQSSSASVKLYPGGKNQTAGGIATVGNSDPKAAVTTLKEAIEAMNAGSNYKGKPAK
ncbi:MAG TPA: hypothetical protein VFF26_06250 [Gallionella sp.]|nr:hypothetical protein [Gallionella sp.]